MLAFALSLVLAPPPVQDYEQAKAKLADAIDQSLNKDRKVALQGLNDAIAAQARFPEEAKDRIPAEFLEARVIEVRLLIAERRDAEAREAVDDLIRTARGQTPPVADFGPEVAGLYEERKAALQEQGMAALEFNCESECSLVVNERRSPGTEQLFLGTYRVWTRAEPGQAWEYQEIELDEAGETWTEEISDPSSPVPQTQTQLATPAAPISKPKQPLLPRAAEIGGLALGAGLFIAGAVMLSLDNRCSRSGEKVTADVTMSECGETIYETTASGAALLGVGGGLLVVSGVMLGIDEVRRGQQKGLEVALGVTLKF